MTLTTTTMWHRVAGGLDLTTAALITSGAALIAVSLVAAIVLLAPSGIAAPNTEASPTAEAETDRPSVALSAGLVATVLNVDIAAGAGVAARPGDHVDVLGYFSRQTTGSASVTQVLLHDVLVMTVERSAAGAALTLAVPQDAALVLQAAQGLGARSFVTLLPQASSPSAAARPTSFSDADLASLLTGGH